MLRLRPYKKCDAQTIVKWIRDEQTFIKWSAGRFGLQFPITADVMNAHYESFDSSEDFWAMSAFDETGVVGHLIMRFPDKDRSVLRFGFIVVDDSKRGKGYGKGMLTLALRYAFEILRVEKVTLGVFEGNESAHKCYLSLGFVQSETTPYEILTIGGKDYKVIELEISREQET